MTKAQIIGVLRSYQRLIERTERGLESATLFDLECSIAHVLHECEKDDEYDSHE
jgi:hypothetical protein